MGAQPKNKITRAERGKRRAGNTPSLKKDPKKTAVPLHKKSLMSKFDNFLSARTGQKTTSAAPKKETAETKKAAPTKASSSAKAGVAPTAAPSKSASSKASPLKATRRTPVNRGK